MSNDTSRETVVGVLFTFAVLAVLFMFAKNLTKKPEPNEPIKIGPFTIACMNPVCKCVDVCNCGENCECNLEPLSQAPRAEAPKEVIMFSRKPCPACDQWWAVQRPKFEQAGYKVGICYDHAFPVTPHFLIQENGKTYEIVGAMSLERLKKEQAR